MIWQPMTSTWLKEAGYDPLSRTLRVRFQSGAVVEYEGIEAEVWEGLQGAESKGRYLRESVVDKFRLRAPEEAE